jgi:hypothetical protein
MPRPIGLFDIDHHALAESAGHGQDVAQDGLAQAMPPTLGQQRYVEDMYFGRFLVEIQPADILATAGDDQPFCTAELSRIMAMLSVMLLEQKGLLDIRRPARLRHLFAPGRSEKLGHERQVGIRHRPV